VQRRPGATRPGTVIRIRSYRDADAAGVGRLVARTYSAFNLGFATSEQRDGLLGPFRFAESAEPAQRAAIAQAIGAPVVLVAEEEGVIVGVLRGGRVDHEGRTILQSLFVDAAHQRRGIGRRLVGRFEQVCRSQGVTRIRVASTLYAVPFYQAMRYQRSTGVRSMRSFETGGLPYQPLKKSLA
jgi:GNAT superfamily N-acetyltransferase